MSKNTIARGTFAQRLLEIRKSKGLTQIELARLTGISTRMIAHYETKVKHPAPESLVLLAKALKISTDELLGSRPLKNEPLVKNKKILRKMKEADQLSPKDQKAVFNFVDALTARHNVAKLKNPASKHDRT